MAVAFYKAQFRDHDVFNFIAGRLMCYRNIVPVNCKVEPKRNL